jgi:integrase
MSLPHRIIKRACRTGYYTTWFDRAAHRQRWRKLAEQMPLARRALAVIQEQITTGGNAAPTTTAMPKTIGEFYRRHYLPDHLAGGDASSWRGKQRLHIERYILPEFARRRLEAVTLYHAEHWYNELQTAHGLSRRYANHIAATFATMLRRALAGGFVSPGQSRDALVGRLADWRRRPNIRRIPQTLTREDVAAIADRLVGRHRVLFVLWIHTGLRPAEMNWLQWADIDLRRRVLHVRAKPGHNIKDNEDRTIPLHDDAIAALTGSQRDSAPIHAPTDWFYPSPRNRKRRHGDFCHHVTRLLAAAGKPGCGGLILRHTFASLLLSSGCPLAELQRYMGHSSIQTTERHYAAFLPPDTSAVHRVDFGLRRAILATIPTADAEHAK